MTLEHLLRHHARTGDADALAMAERTLEAMARGGIHDQLAGGFARYSVDAEWVVPHFEKMLYDNAQLLRVYAHWHRATGDELAGRVAGSTADFLVRDLRTDEGGSPRPSTPTRSSTAGPSRAPPTCGPRRSSSRSSARRTGAGPPSCSR